MATYYVDPSTASGQLTGTWTFTTASTAVTAAADGNAVAELAVGDYIKVSDGVVWYKIARKQDELRELQYQNLMRGDYDGR